MTALAFSTTFTVALIFYILLFHIFLFFKTTAKIQNIW
jgi:hypothetical protein